MLTDGAMKGIGKYALAKKDKQLFGVGKPNKYEAMEMLLYSFALSNPQYITEQDRNNIKKRIADKHI